MSLDIEFALRDAKLDKYVTVEDAVVDGVEYVVIRPNGYLGRETFGKIARELEQFKVEYLSLGKNSHWRTKKETIMQMQPQEPKAVSIDTMMPKGIDSQPAYKDAGNAFPTKPLDGDGRSKQTTQPQTQKCVLCDSTEDLVLHHKRYSPNLTRDDFVVLCRPCHTKIHIGGSDGTVYAIDFKNKTIAYVLKGKPLCCLCLNKKQIVSFDSEAEFFEHFSKLHMES